MIAASSMFKRAEISLRSYSTLASVIIQPGFVRSMTTAPFDSNTGFRLARLLAPANIIVRHLLPFAPSPEAVVSLARMPSGFAEIEKPLRSETVRERRSS
jgi:hypothetical protein